MATQNRTKTVLTLAVVAMALLTTSAQAVIVPIVAVTANHGGDRYGNGLISLYNGSGMDMTVDPADPSTWVCTVTDDYGNEWMGNFLDHLDPPDVPTLNSKIAWVVFDLGSPTGLEGMYIWNIRYAGDVAGTQTYNLYYADAPAAALPAEPEKGATAITGLTPQGDYDFAGSGWSKFNTSGILTVPKGGDSFESLIGITARYIGIEIITGHGDVYKGGRVGFSEIAFTANDDPNAPDADAGANWITWSGQEVDPNASIVEKEPTDWTNLTYDWTADAPDGVTVQFDPDTADVIDPTVTITKFFPTGEEVTVTLTLEVWGEGKPVPVADTMKIDVYDDACLATIAAGQEVAFDPTDITADCITNLKDFAVLAMDWLSDYVITAPVPK